MHKPKSVPVEEVYLKFLKGRFKANAKTIDAYVYNTRKPDETIEDLEKNLRSINSGSILKKFFHLLDLGPSVIPYETLPEEQELDGVTYELDRSPEKTRLYVEECLRIMFCICIESCFQPTPTNLDPNKPISVTTKKKDL